ncbi:hypothetical protein ATDW_30460 [Asticcacaulis sp. DW145]|uniref:hypothetical protein n=1 Tax=Asticcacaulis sp. DW145 TaxID=3095608 RepID=UPI003084C12D|nr:hypothetical protein ATDW_30460 [Asticcacaulis sp. DW145]
MKDHAATVAALGVLAMCLVTVSHEVVGHGVACALAGGQITHVSTTLFACSVPMFWVAVGGPIGNLVAALVAATLAARLPASHTTLRLFLITVVALSLFWEAGYLIKVMLFRDGDLYFFAYGLLGPYGVWPFVGATLGAVLYLWVIAMISRLFASVLGDPRRARRAALILWLAATAGAVIAALPFKGDRLPTIRDALLGIGLASIPLLLFRWRGQPCDVPIIARQRGLIITAGFALILMTATLGRGIGAF